MQTRTSRWFENHVFFGMLIALVAVFVVGAAIVTIGAVAGRVTGSLLIALVVMGGIVYAICRD